MADLEGVPWVPWVPWNSSFDGLPSKILWANLLHSLRSHWICALQLPSSNNSLLRIRRTRMAYVEADDIVYGGG